ncbi:MAG: hypothetical protein JKY99_02295 [Rhizobiales bacterium]|nr:hypothetical protein [Hyphomicrobiales bacterium]PHQ72415.1 MAG: hypothetical protein COB93_00290 [Sneathiella sp.]
MADEKYPLEGFQITNYDEKNRVVTIQIHRRILRDPNQQTAILKKAMEILEFTMGIPNISDLSGIIFEIRDGT